ncbi:sulfate/molybdate ABC transporter ATP-binding protein [Microbacterium sp. AK031]|uniref:sulfate/molybdate ABC transporter ATP-binding protein n=1 Tax=Microbacterium sp. AK031 TaxID=2723076 RepID=UPI0021687D9B|nr:ATP-binding cassette domain-containing protein [Microbacterium sp. AK031]MCS3844426.1 molybdate transport system ATP-binding protein [Microbacterium sp. AK031]
MKLDVDVRARVGTFMLEAAITAAEGEVLAILGPNGSGKSTLLGAIAGHLDHVGRHAEVTGRITLGGRMLDQSVPPERRRIGLLGQHTTLFPHLTALDNVAFGPRAQRMRRADAEELARRHLADVGLGDLGDRRPSQLSGGQRQRVALARALAAAPDALLLDEPFAALDAQTSAQARRLVSQLRDRVSVPMVLVTHDPMDAVMLASRTVVLHEGRVVQEGSTRDVLGHPNSPFVAAIAGVNLVSGIASSEGILHTAGDATSTTGATIGPNRWIGHGDRLAPGEAGTAVFSPGAVRVHPGAARAFESLPASDDSGTAPNMWSGTVAHLEAIPGGVRLFTTEHPDIAVDCSSMAAVDAGIRPDAVLTFSVLEQDVSVRRSH